MAAIDSANDSTKVELDALADVVNRLDGRIGDVGTVATAIRGELDSLPATYGTLITDLAALADGSSDPAILTANAELDLLTTEYLAAKTKINSVLAALA